MTTDPDLAYNATCSQCGGEVEITEDEYSSGTFVCPDCEKTIDVVSARPEKITAPSIPEPEKFRWSSPAIWSVVLCLIMVTAWFSKDWVPRHYSSEDPLLVTKGAKGEMLFYGGQLVLQQWAAELNQTGEILFYVGVLLGLPAVILGLVGITSIARKRKRRKGYAFAVLGVVLGAAPLVMQIPIQTCFSRISKIIFCEREMQDGVSALLKYHIDHSRFPAHLEDLTAQPAYLSELPLDPFTDEGKAPLHYYADGDGSCILVSMGPDRIRDIDNSSDLSINDSALTSKYFRLDRWLRSRGDIVATINHSGEVKWSPIQVPPRSWW